LREQGFDLEEIATKLGVSKSSVSHWVRDVPLHERLSYEECRKRAAEGARTYWESERPVREAHRDAAGVARDQLIYRVMIHENAEIEAAERFWLGLTGADPSQFRRPTLKRHNPKTVRKNIGDAYRGCLRIDVRRGTELYRRIEGWARAAMAGPPTVTESPSAVQVAGSTWRRLSDKCAAPGEGFEPSLTHPK
jgi:transcriptional regulator with XRE-family HTH domain